MERRQFLRLAALATGGAWQGALLGAPDDPRVRAIGRLIETKMAEHRIPGVAFGLLKNGQSTFRGFGLTNIDNPQPVTPETVFPIASISKTVVATALMRLVEDGRLDLDALVRDLIAEFRVRDESASREVRIWHLLTHTPGFEGQLPTTDRGDETLAQFTAGLRDLPQLAPPGTVWSYNNAGFGVAGRILEVATGSTIHDALNHLVFEPLGLTHAFTSTGTAMTHRFAAGHREQSGRTEVIRPFELPANVAAGGAAMSISSLLRYAQFHLGEGTVNEKRVLSRESLGKMRASRLVKNSTSDEMGLGWQLRRLDGVWTAAHGGTLAGHCLHLQLVPERNLAFGILTNHNSGWRLIQAVERAILESYEGLSLARNQATGGNRGGNEDMTVHAIALAEQPAVAPYVGTYQRPPSGTAEVRAEGAGLVVRGGGAGDLDVPLVFWGPDLAYAAPRDEAAYSTPFYPYRGMPIEFIRKPDGAVGWIRINGRIAAKEI